MTAPNHNTADQSGADQLRAALTKILEQPNETFSDGKALAAIVKIARAALASSQPVAGHPSDEQHKDDMCVDLFAVAMKQKLAQAREKGRGGWEGCDPVDLSKMLREHVDKGDPRDVANFCMFLHYMGEPINTANAGKDENLIIEYRVKTSASHGQWERMEFAANSKDEWIEEVIKEEAERECGYSDHYRGYEWRRVKVKS